MGVGPFLDSFAELVPTLAASRCRTPAGTGACCSTSSGSRAPEAMSALTIGSGRRRHRCSTCSAAGCSTSRPRGSRRCCSVFVPTALLYGATTADALFATLALFSAYLPALDPSLGGRRRRGPARFRLLLLVRVAGRRRMGGTGPLATGRLPLDAAAVACLCAALLVFYGLLALLTGFDVLGSIEATHDRYYKGVASIRPYLLLLRLAGSLPGHARSGRLVRVARSLGSREITALALAAAILVTVAGRLYEGRDRADLDLPGPDGLPRGRSGAARAASAAGAGRPRRPGRS